MVCVLAANPNNTQTARPEGTHDGCFFKDDFMLQLISTGEYIDDNPGHGGDTYAVRVYVLRLNPFTLNEWWKSQILNHRNTYGTEEEWEAYKAGKEKPQTAFKEKVADFLKVDLSLGSLCVTQEVKFMSINIKTDRMRAAILFHKSVLFTPERIPDNDVPDGWHRYDLRGSIRNARNAGKPTAISDHAYVNRIGSILSPIPLMREGTVLRRVNGQFLLLGSALTLREYCRDNGLDFPAKNQNFHIRPASPEEAGLFYALSPEEDAEQGAIGHVRIDFGRSGSEFHPSWWPRGPEELNTPAFKQELGEVVDELRLSVLKGLGSMHSYCSGHGGKIEGGVCCQNYGYVVETERYLYRLRCNPTPGDYQAYLSCFDKQAQTLGLTEKGRQVLKDAADPGRREFERLFGRNADYSPEDVVRIIYGRNMIYKAAPFQAEGPAQNTGGMRFE